MLLQNIGPSISKQVVPKNVDADYIGVMAGVRSACVVSHRYRRLYSHTPGEDACIGTQMRGLATGVKRVLKEESNAAIDCKSASAAS